MATHMSEIEKMFNADVRDKKRTGTGAFKMRGKGKKHGFSGAIRTPYSMLTGKEKREYIKPGKVRSYFVYETFMKMEEFERQSKGEQKRLMEMWRNHHSNGRIMKELGINKNVFYKLIDVLDVQRKTAAGGEARGAVKPEDKRYLTDQEFEDMEKDIRAGNLPDYKTNFKFIEINQKRALFRVIDDLYSMEEIIKAWDVDRSVVYSIRYGIKKQDEKAAKKKQEQQEQEEKRKKAQRAAAVKEWEQEQAAKESEMVHQDPQPEPIREPEQEQLTLETASAPEPAPAPIQEKEPQPLTNGAAPNMEEYQVAQKSGSNLSLYGDYTAEDLKKKLEKFASLLEGEGGRYSIHLEINEQEPSKDAKTSETSANGQADIIQALGVLGKLLNN